jgi:hypothetical protein
MGRRSVLVTSGLAAMLPLAAISGVTQAQSSNSVSVTIGVSIPPLANITFPEGQDFVLTSVHPHPAGQILDPVRIPFTVRGNASASVSVAPVGYFELASGQCVGRAAGVDGEGLGYNIVVQFPVPSPDHDDLPGTHFGATAESDGFASLPEGGCGATAPATPPVAADMTAEESEAFGTIHVVSRRQWRDGPGLAPPGD